MLMGYGFFEILTGRVMTGLWIVLIALFIRNAARSSYRHHLMSQLQDVTRRAWEGRYHRHPFGPEHRAGPRRVAPDPHGEDPEPGRDVTHLSGNEV